jgi:hypothetical protein
VRKFLFNCFTIPNPLEGGLIPLLLMADGPDVLIQESLPIINDMMDDGLFEREYRMGINALKKLLDRHNSTIKRM